MQSGNYKSHNYPDVDTNLKYVDLVIRVSFYFSKAGDKAQMNGLSMKVYWSFESSEGAYHGHAQSMFLR